MEGLGVSSIGEPLTRWQPEPTSHALPGASLPAASRNRFPETRSSSPERAPRSHPGLPLRLTGGLCCLWFLSLEIFLTLKYAFGVF